MGYSRESALYLLDNRRKSRNEPSHRDKYLVIQKPNIFIKESVFQCNNLGVVEESKAIKVNYPDNFESH